MNYQEISKQLRSNLPELPPQELLEPFIFLPDEENDYDLNYEKRELITIELFPFVAEDRPILRFLLHEEMKDCSNEIGLPDLQKILCYLLAKLKNLDDFFILYYCKCGGIGFDAMMGLDWEMVLLSGSQNVLNYLDTLPENYEGDEYYKSLKEADHIKCVREDIVENINWLFGKEPESDVLANYEKHMDTFCENYLMYVKENI